jgi:hypothetical protein
MSTSRKEENAMKLLLIVVALLLGFVILIIAVGAMIPKHHTASRTAVLRATPEQIFALISGPQDWRTDLKEYKFFDQNGHSMVRETDKHGQTINYEIVQSQPSTLLKRTIADKNVPFGGSWTWNIRRQDDGSAVTITEDGEVYNPLFRFVSKFIMGHTRTIDNYLSMLSTVTETHKRVASSTD